LNAGDVSGFPNYDENYYEIEVEKISETRYRFTVTFNDADTGDPSVDEDVRTNINSNVFVETPSGDYISLPVPVFSEGPGNSLVLA